MALLIIRNTYWAPHHAIACCHTRLPLDHLRDKHHPSYLPIGLQEQPTKGDNRKLISVVLAQTWSCDSVFKRLSASHCRCPSGSVNSKEQVNKEATARVEAVDVN